MRCSVTKARVEALMQESQDAHYKLEITPTTTEEYVTFLTFLDDISIRVRPPLQLGTGHACGRRDLDSAAATCPPCMNVVTTAPHSRQ